MSRRALALSATAALIVGLVAVAIPDAAAAPPPRFATGESAWVNPRLLSIDNDTEGHGLADRATPQQQYGPDGWETLYLDRAGELQDVRVTAAGTTVARVPLGSEGVWSDFPGVFDVDPKTGNAVVCNWLGDDGTGARIPRFVTRTGADGAWSQPRTATLPAGQFAVQTSCAVNGSQVMIAVGTQTNRPVVDYFNPRDTGGAAGLSTLDSSDPVTLTELEPTLHGDTASSRQSFQGVETATAVTAAAAGDGFAVALAITAAKKVPDTSPGAEPGATKTEWTTETSLTKVNGSVANAPYYDLQAATFGDRPSGGGDDTDPPGVADLGSGAVLVTNQYGGFRITDNGAEQVIASVRAGTPAPGFPSSVGTTVVPQTSPGAAWVLSSPENYEPPRLYRVTSTTMSAGTTLPADSGIDDAMIAWWSEDERRFVAAPDGSLWLGMPCVDTQSYTGNTSCLARYTTDGTRVGRVEATSNVILPTTATTAEGLALTGDRNPAVVHFDSEAPQDSAAGIAVGTTPRSDGSYVYAAGSPTPLSVTTTDATVGGGALLHRWAVNGTALPKQDFDAGSSDSVSYQFPGPGLYEITHRAQDQAGNLSTPTSTTVRIVGAGAPLTNLGPVTGLAVAGQQKATTGVDVTASWNGLTSADDGYDVVIRDANFATIAQRSTTETTATLTVPASAGPALQVVVSPVKGTDTGMPAQLDFTLIDARAPTGTFAVAPATAWAKVTAVTVTQSALSDDRDAAASLTRTVTWGDGTSETWAQPRTTLTHTYAKAGTFTPAVTVKDTSGNESTYPTAAVKVTADTSRPTATVTRPAKASLASVAAWRTLRGTAKDTGTGLKTLAVTVIEKRGTRFYGYDYAKRTWSRGVTTAAAARSLSRATVPTVASSGAWAAPTIAGLTKGTITVYVAATDRAGNVGSLTVSQALTR